jgi:crotonobetainyl-CoA:carnitine CoA-transferase CaiB-like acyl-CoA transferase
MVVELPGPSGERVRQVGISVRLSETPGRVRSPGPTTGQHTEEVLTGLGYSREEIERLRREGAIQ